MEPVQPYLRALVQGCAAASAHERDCWTHPCMLTRLPQVARPGARIGCSIVEAFSKEVPWAAGFGVTGPAWKPDPALLGAVRT